MAIQPGDKCMKKLRRSRKIKKICDYSMIFAAAWLESESCKGRRVLGTAY
jgi:hypothetical protein